VIFHRDDLAAGDAGGRDQRLAVDRLHRVQVNHANERPFGP
jgi:hypothetical protein